MIPTYNCAKYLRKTLRSVLQQDLGIDLMQIEVIDDCSSDSVAEVVQEIGGDRVGFYRQRENVGHVRNFETALNRARGKVVHLLHGDDFVLPGFYTSMMQAYESFPDIGACYCRHFFVDELNDILGISRKEANQDTVLYEYHKSLLQGQRIQTPSITVKREVFEKLGGFNAQLAWTEDWEMWVRICKHYPMGYIKNPLAAYRIHQVSSTGAKALTGENVRDLFRLKQVFLDSIVEPAERPAFERSFRRVIFKVAESNYLECKKLGNPNAIKHLRTMGRYSETRVRGLFYFLKYLLLSFGY
ncbi:glycosyltransferase [Cyclobacterium xiamenense]